MSTPYYPPPSPPSYISQPPKEDKSIIWVIVVILVVLIVIPAILAGVLYFWVGSFMGNFEFSPYASLSKPEPITVGNTTSIEITSISKKIDSNDVLWYLRDEKYKTVAGNKTLGNANVTISDNGVNITWYDNDGDGKLSQGDSFTIGAEDRDILDGYSIRFTYKKTGDTIATATFRYGSF